MHHTVYISIPCHGTKEVSHHDHGDVNMSQNPATLRKSVNNSGYK
jgi:hypothetical protein